MAIAFNQAQVITPVEGLSVDIRQTGLKIPLERQKTIAQGAATSVFLATSPLLEGIGERYFEDCNEAAIVTSGSGYMSGIAPYALNPNNADRLWDGSQKIFSDFTRPLKPRLSLTRNHNYDFTNNSNHHSY